MQAQVRMLLEQRPARMRKNAHVRLQRPAAAGVGLTKPVVNRPIFA
jgi:hypothetical protein